MVSVRGAPIFLDARVVQFLLPRFEVNGREQAAIRVLALRTIEHLDVSEHVLPCNFAGQAGRAPDAFPLQDLEESFGDRTAVAVNQFAQAGLEIVLAEEHLPFAVGERRSLIGGYHHFDLGFAPPNVR